MTCFHVVIQRKRTAQNEYLHVVAQFGFDKAENEPLNIWGYLIYVTRNLNLFIPTGSGSRQRRAEQDRGGMLHHAWIAASHRLDIPLECNDNTDEPRLAHAAGKDAASKLEASNSIFFVHAIVTISTVIQSLFEETQIAFGSAIIVVTLNHCFPSR